MNNASSGHPFWNGAAPPPHAPRSNASQSNADADVWERTPFVAEIRRRNLTADGSFAPGARLVLTTALRTESLWHALPGEEIKTLLLVLTFLAPDGTCRPALAELAPAMRLPEGKARARLERLVAFRWQGAPVLRELPRDSGLHAFVPAPNVLAAAEAPSEASQEAAQAPLERRAGREAVVAHSRTLYARPRAEVEREMAERMGWQDPDAVRQEREREETALTDEGRDLLARLLGLGVERAKALEILTAHAPDRIRRQLEWLPHRGAKNPVRFLAAAVAGDYAPPAGLRAPGMKPEPQAQEARDRERRAQERQASETEAASEERAPKQEIRQEDDTTANAKEALPANGTLPTSEALPTLDTRALDSSDRSGSNGTE